MIGVMVVVLGSLIYGGFSGGEWQTMWVVAEDGGCGGDGSCGGEW